MSTDARHSENTVVDQVELPQGSQTDQSAGTVEVLIRLPDLRHQQSGSKSDTEASPKQTKGDSIRSDSGASTTGLLGPVFDSLRHRWSTWKNAAMFAQAGMFSRALVVGGVMLVMVVAAYLLMNRKDEPADAQPNLDNTAQQSVPDVSHDEPDLLAVPAPSQHTPIPPIEVNTDWAAMPLEAAAPTQPPTARLDLEPNDTGPGEVRHAVNVNQQHQRSSETYSSDARFSESYQPNRGPAEYGEYTPTRSAHRPNYEQYDSPTRDNRDTNDRFNSTDRYAPNQYRGSRTEPRYSPDYSNPPPRADFRGTIEPAPYRIR